MGMKLLRGVQEFAEFSHGTVTTIGNFDGVHRGHQALLATLSTQAKRMKLPMVVMLFDPQPGEFFYGKKAPTRLSSLREKAQLLKRCGVDYIYCLKFDKILAAMAADEFADHYLFKLLQSKYLITGQDFRFGADRVGDIGLLHQLSTKYGCGVYEFRDFFIDEERVSSTKVRQLLSAGALDYAAKLLGRTYHMCGRVVAGDGLGRQWGVPTANLKLSRHQRPLRGVFCVTVKRYGKPDLFGVANFGCRPTISGSKNSLEIHLLDFNESLYGEFLEVCFLKKLRDEIKFPSVELLISQIHNDIAAAKLFYKEEDVLA
jgi:riboflavin kinase/FMN adenylyltransferase